MKKLFIIRHGQTFCNEKGCFTGLKDDLLTDLGKEQSRLLAGVLLEESITKVYTSKLRRTLDTAQPFMDLAELGHTAYDYFNERDLGPFNGHPTREVFQKYPDFADITFNAPVNDLGVENTLDFIDRIKKGIGILDSDTEENLALFTHGGTIRTLVPILTNTPIENNTSIKNTSVTVLKKNDDQDFYSVEVLASTDHLD